MRRGFLSSCMYFLYLVYICKVLVIHVVLVLNVLRMYACSNEVYTNKLENINIPALIKPEVVFPQTYHVFTGGRS